MKKLILILLLAFMSLSSGLLKGEAATAKQVPPEVIEKKFLYEVAKHLHRWYLDEIDIENINEKEDMVFLFRVLDMKLDEGDKSQYVEIIIPALKLSVKMKKADYRIDELDVTVKSKYFKINNVARYGKEFEIPEGCVSVTMNVKEMKDYLFKTRHDVEFPSPELNARIKKAFRKEFTDVLMKMADPKKLKGERITFISPLSPVANEFWVFMEHGKLLLHCSSDIDLDNPALWEHASLTFKLYDAFNQTVVSLDEAAGDNSFMTRAQIGRALYNCVVLGQRIIVFAAEAEKDMPRPAGK